MQVYAYLKSIGVNPDLLWTNIERAVVQVLLSAEPAFLRKFKALRSDYTCANCYQLLGVDVIVDDDLVPRVIEPVCRRHAQRAGVGRREWAALRSSATSPSLG